MTIAEAIDILKEVLDNMKDDLWYDEHLYGKTVDVIEWLKRPLGDRLIEILREERDEEK